MEAPGYNVLDDYRVHRLLGRGGEGTVYLAEKKQSPGLLILKVLHDPVTDDWLPGLPVYARKIRPNGFGLPLAKLIYRENKILGVVYPYIPLTSLHWRILHSNEKVAQSVIGSYCRKQHYLISEYGLALWDPTMPNMMVDKAGKWHYCDMGGGIGMIDHPYLIRNGLLGYGFASLLMSIYNKTLYQLIMPGSPENYSYDAPCIYWQNEWLDTIATQHKWVKELLSDVLCQKSAIFLDPEFYQCIGDRFPDRVPWPSFTLPFSKTLTRLGKLRGKLGV